MSDNFRIVWDNRAFDEADLTASSEATGLPATNLQDPQRKKVWRTTGVTNQKIEIDLGDNKYIQCLALINYNFSPAATMDIVGSQNSDYSDPEYENEGEVLWPTVYGYGEGGYGEHGYGGTLTEEERQDLFNDCIRLIWIPNVNARYWKIEFSDPDNSDGYFEIGRIFLAPYFEPRYNFGYGWTVKIAHDTTIVRSVGGQDWANIKGWYHVCKLPLPIIDRTNKYADFLNLCKRLGTHTPFILDLFPNSKTTDEFYNTFYGRLTDTLEISGQFSYSTSEITFKEVL